MTPTGNLMSRLTLLSILMPASLSWTMILASREVRASLRRFLNYFWFLLEDDSKGETLSKFVWSLTGSGGIDAAHLG